MIAQQFYHPPLFPGIVLHCNTTPYVNTVSDKTALILQKGDPMLITFKSKAAAEIVMYKEHARRILDLLHKDVEQGIITTAELPAAIASIEAAIAESKIHLFPLKSRMMSTCITMRTTMNMKSR
jgi:hypothetical protein